MALPRWLRVPTRVRVGVLAAALAGSSVASVAAAPGAGREPVRPQHRAAQVAAPGVAGTVAGTGAATGTPPPVVVLRGRFTGGLAAGTAPPRAPAAELAPPSQLAASGIPSTALAAYRGAAAVSAATDPACHLPWPLLAGIGRVESNHGRFAGAVLHTDGLSTPRIVGIPLDGNGTALIRDTDHGRLDGDTVYDRAVGPMQFIPSTWATWGRDGNHDGRRDPFNLFDAAAAAAAYLCAAGRDLATYAGQVAAVLSYNHSTAYVDEVLGVERVYAAGVGVTVPVVPTDPAQRAAPTTRPPRLPPADPGPPRALIPPAPPATSAPRTSAAPSGSAVPSAPVRPSSPAAGSGSGTDPATTAPADPSGTDPTDPGDPDGTPTDPPVDDPGTATPSDPGTPSS